MRHKIENVSAVVVTDTYQGKVRLLVSERTGSDVYTLPGGKIEIGETQVAAARRELFEETGLTCPVDELTWMTESNPILLTTSVGSKIHLDMFLLFKEACEGKITQREKAKHKKWKYMPINSIIDLTIDGLLPRQVLQVDWIDEIMSYSKDYSSWLEAVPSVRQNTVIPSWVVT